VDFEPLRRVVRFSTRVRLKEANGGNVTVVNVGPAENDQVIRKALAIGADDAIRIDVTVKLTLTLLQQKLRQWQNPVDTTWCF
jgi:hypothetical protein